MARLAPPMLAAMLAASVFLVAGSCGSAGLADFGSSRVVPDELPVDEPEAVTELGLVAVVGLVAVGAVGVGGEPIEFDGVSEVLGHIAARGVQTAVVTSNARTNVETVLGPSATHIRHYACGASIFGKAAKLTAVMKAARARP